MHLKIGVIMGGFTPERHISLESGRNVYSKLVASTKYKPLPLFLSGSKEVYRIFTLPTALLLKDNADDIHDRLLHPSRFSASEQLLTSIRKEASSITRAYAKNPIFRPEEVTFGTLKKKIDFMFIALHGRPGEDGTLQKLLEDYSIPYNGSGITSTALTIDKYATNQFLAQQGFHVAKQVIINKQDWVYNQAKIIHAIEKTFSYPIIAKPVDDGCSAGVIKIAHRDILVAYAFASFRNEPFIESDLMQALDLPLRDDIPRQERFLLEELIQKDQETISCLETTTGLLTHMDPSGKTIYEIFEPSETVATNAILSLEEKFLAGEGNNITPARFHRNGETASIIRKRVKSTLASIAKILNLQGYARIDAFVKIYSDKKLEVWVIEINALPAMTPATCIFHQAALNGYTPLDFIDKIIEYGLKKRNFSTFLETVNLNR